jgi:hypothetical protein
MKPLSTTPITRPSSAERGRPRSDQTGRWSEGDPGDHAAPAGSGVSAPHPSASTNYGAGAGRGGAAQDVAGDDTEAHDRSEDRIGLVVDDFLVEVDDTAGIRQIVRQEDDAASC